MNIKLNKQCHITTSLAFLGALSISLLLFGGLIQPREAKAAAITCSSGVSGCHFTPTVKDGTGRNVPDGRFTGSHARHAGYSTGSTKRQYTQACTRCHPSTSYNNSHQSGYKNITGTSIPRASYSKTSKILNTNSPVFGNCSNLYCHSNGRGTNMGTLQYSSARWGGTETCLGCHGGRSTAGPNYIPVASVGNFTLSTSHSQHLKYPVGNINCQICHSKTATNATTLKSYTGISHHVNGVRDVTFTDIAYASYTSYKSTEAGSAGTTRVCNNTSCHGGQTRSAWSATTNNTNHTCTHCHGVATGVAAGLAVTGANRYNLRFFAPGWGVASTRGTSTDQIASSNDRRVGSHFKHLSSVYMKNIKCNECHKVPSTPFSTDTNHTLNTNRFNSATLDFSQSSSAKILIGVASGSTPAQLSSFAGYTNGTASTAATCSSVYCHGNRLKTGETGGTYKKPYWNYSTLINYTQASVCSRCHGYPPTAASHATTTTCSDCHSNVRSADQRSFVNKLLHINGQVEASGGDCIGCHGTNTKGIRRAVGADFTGTSHHVTSGTLTKWHCIICHAEGDTSTGGTTSLHTMAASQPVDLRNVDSPGNPGTAGTNYWSMPVTMTAAAWANMDLFCFKCHDSVGSASVAYNGTNVITSGLTATQQQKPFNDNLTNSYDGVARTRVVDVDTQFTATNFSHHAVKAAKYTAAGGLPFQSTTYSKTLESLGVTNVDDNSRLHCHDCHLKNSHGSVNAEYMLQDSSGADALGGAGTYNCMKCHTSAYSTDHAGGNASDFATGRTGSGNVVGMTCAACHNCGGMMWGGIHGGNWKYATGATPGWTTAGNTATTGQSTYRFMPGMNNNGYQANNWTAASSATTCYTNPNASWGGCSKHTGGSAQTTTRTAGARALSY